MRYKGQTCWSTLIECQSDFVVCRYDERWWIGFSEKIHDDEADAAINDLRTPGPANILVWPTRTDIFCIPESDLIMKNNTPTTATGRITPKESFLISKSFLQLFP